MLKSLSLAVAVSLVAMAGARAQANGQAGGAPSGGGADLRSNYITSTGATVPHPGTSQSGGTTSLDLGVQREDNKIQNGICKGC